MRKFSPESFGNAPVDFMEDLMIVNITVDMIENTISSNFQDQPLAILLYQVHTAERVQKPRC